jgi:hypothetical protein
MRVGLIVEGRSDAAVLTNILKGKLNISKSDIQYLVPEFDYDETSLFRMRNEQFSNWTIVKNNCRNKQKISDFIDSFENERFIVIHIDSDTRMEVGYEVNEPINVNNVIDIETLRQNIVNKLSEWLENEFFGKIAFAIAITEIDSWILTLYADHETGLLINAKERLLRILNDPSKFTRKEKQKIFSLRDDKFEQYNLLSQDFRKPKKLMQFQTSNVSLRLFCEDLERFEGY